MVGSGSGMDTLLSIACGSRTEAMDSTCIGTDPFEIMIPRRWEMTGSSEWQCQRRAYPKRPDLDQFARSGAQSHMSLSRRSSWAAPLAPPLFLLLLCGVVTVDGQTPAPVVPAPITPAPTPNTTLPPLSPSPSALPSLSNVPSSIPTAEVTDSPSESPTISLQPTLSPAPSGSPTVSRMPTSAPSDMPSSMPSFTTPFVVRQLFRQQFLIPNKAAFNETEQIEINSLLAMYGALSLPDPQGVITVCTIENEGQTLSDCFSTLPECQAAPTEFINEVDYQCSWTSVVTNVTGAEVLFLEFMNTNLDSLVLDMRTEGLNVTQALTVRPISRSTEAPTGSPMPTDRPSLRPSFSSAPSMVPSTNPSTIPPVSEAPSMRQTFPLPTARPSLSPTTESSGSLSTGVIIGLVLGLGIAGLLGLLFLFYFFRRRKEEGFGQSGRSSRHQDAYSEDGIDAMNSPADSLVSRPSMLSEGDQLMDGHSGEEADGTKNLQDEFDQYKDQNIEQLRSDVEENLAGFEGIMSAAVTKILMGDEEDIVDPAELLWGCQANPSSSEVEASALCEVNDWMKRNDNSSVERKRLFMQDLLNKMLASVRYGVLEAPDASRTIHESAALLGLPLANELPMTTLILSGMRKTVNAQQLLRALQEFGEIDTAAVASGQRGFAIVRFRNTKSVDRVMRKYRANEIVVMDVAVQIRVLMPSGAVESRAM